MPTYTSWQCTSQAQGDRELFTAPFMLPPGWVAGSNGLVCLLTHFVGSSWDKKQKCWPLMQEPVAMLFVACLGSGSAKISESSLDLPGQFRVSRGPDSLDNLQSSVTIYGSLSKPNSESSHSPISNRNTSQNKVCCQVLATSYEVGQAAWRWGRVRRDGLLEPGLGGQGMCNHPCIQTWTKGWQQKETEHNGGSFSWAALWNQFSCPTQM